MANQILNTGIYLSLLAQLDKLARHNRQGSFRTKERYYEAMKRFCAFLADAFRLQKLSNINGKHLTAYILKLQDDGKAPSTIKTDLAAIRFFHDLMDAKYKLPDNEELKVALQRRTFGGVDRTWSREEFSRMLAEALRLGREDYVTILYLARYAGLRIHECFRIDTAIAAQAVREGAITIKGKGGLVRTVPLHPLLVSRLELHLQTTPRGHKLFVPDDMETHTAIQHLQAIHPGRRLGASHDFPRPPPCLRSGVVSGADRCRSHALRGPQGGLPAPGAWPGRCDEDLSRLPPGDSYRGALVRRCRPL